MAITVGTDLKRTVDGYRQRLDQGDDSANTEIFEALDDIVSGLDKIKADINSGSLNLEEQLNTIKQNITKVIDREVVDLDLKKLINHVIERAQVELIKVMKSAS